MEQSGTAKCLPGQVLLNWLTAAADGHGGIQSIAKLSTSGLVDTYRITLADTTTFDFVVTNGRGISDIAKTSTSGLVDTYTITYNNGTTSTLTIKNGEKGDKGDNTYTWIKYASQEPTESSHSMGDIPDDWIGIYSGKASTAPTDWKQYKWFKIKGEQGDTGYPATIVSQSVAYQVSDSGTIIPSGTWETSVPVVGQGKYLWTRTEITYNTGSPVVSYSVSRMGIDGSGSVSSVAGVSPDETGNVALTAADVGALAASGGDMTGAINMNGQPISGLNDPTEDTQAARKGYVDTAKTAANAYTDTAKAEANAYTDASVRKAAPRNLLDNSDFRNPVNQRKITTTQSTYTFGYTLDRWRIYGGTAGGVSGIRLTDTGVEISLGGTSAYFDQLLDIDPSKTYTFAAETDDGIYLVSGVPATGAQNNMLLLGLRSDGFVRCAFINISKVHNIHWAALYEGEYTAETLPEYQPKGYGAELLECQRYFRLLKIGGAVNGNYIGYRIPLSPAMRTNPSTTEININTTSGPATITVGGHSAESDCFRVDAYIGSDADKWWVCDVGLSADL